MQKITTGDLARAISAHFPIATDDMVRGWVEDGSLKSWRNPSGGWFFIDPQCVKPFLINYLSLTQEETLEVLAQLGLNFTQLTLKMSA